MGSQDSVAAVGSAAFDTAPFIYLIEGNDQRGPKAVELFRSLESVPKATSIITPIEILTFCQAPGREDLDRMYREYFTQTDELSVWPVDWEIAEECARLRAKYRLRIPDAIQIATALIAGADVFITNDRRLLKVPEIKVVLFDEWTP